MLLPHAIVCAGVFSKWEPFGSPSVFHLAMVELVDMLHSAVELREVRVVKLSIVEGDYEGGDSSPLGRPVSVLIGTIVSP